MREEKKISSLANFSLWQRGPPPGRIIVDQKIVLMIEKLYDP